MEVHRSVAEFFHEQVTEALRTEHLEATEPTEFLDAVIAGPGLPPCVSFEPDFWVVPECRINSDRRLDQGDGQP